MNWYVLFVKTGYEQKMEREISKVWKVDGLKPFIPTYDARFRKAGKLILEKRKLFPGYIFIESKISGIEFYITVRPFIIQSGNAFKLLRYGRDNEGNYSYEMNEEEQLAFLNLYNDEYCVEMSKGFIAGESVVITDGPLKGFESKIKKVNRHRLEAVVEVTMMRRITEVKVGLEIIEKMSKKQW